MGLMQKIVAGSPATKSRLHDQYGNRIPIGRLLRNGPRAFLSTLQRLALGRRPRLPWIAYDAHPFLAAHLSKRSRVLEFGSGMSTRWYADHAGEVISIEDYRPWYDKVRESLQADYPQVTYRFAATPEEYASVLPAERGEGFDLIMIDGSWRDKCMDLAIDLVRPGGMIYLDNADKKDTHNEVGNMPLARRKLLDFAAAKGVVPQWYTDFSPTYFFVQTGLAVRLPE